MANSTNTQLAPLIERARKVLQYEQRGNHQDRVVNGGLELFVVRWADEVSAICKMQDWIPSLFIAFTEQLEGYRRQDPMQRAASLRAALTILNELETDGQSNNAGSSSRSQTPPHPMPTQVNKTENKGSTAITGSLSLGGESGGHLHIPA